MKVTAPDGYANTTIECPHCSTHFLLATQASTKTSIKKLAPATQLANHQDPGPVVIVTKSRKRRVFVWCAALAAAFLVGLASLLVIVFWRCTPMSEFATVVPDEAATAFKLNLEAIRKVAGVEAEMRDLDTALKGSLRDLGLQPATATLTGLFECNTKSGDELQLWLFDQPVQLDNADTRRFQPQDFSGVTIWKDQFTPKSHWAVDRHGRLLHGPQELIESAMARQRSKRITTAGQDMSRWASGMPTNSLAWMVSNGFEGTPIPLPLADELRGTRVDGQFFSLQYAEQTGPVVTGRWYFPTHSDAKTFAAALAGLKTNLAITEMKLVANALAESRSQRNGKEVDCYIPLPLALARLALQAASENLTHDRTRADQRIQAAYRNHMAKGELALANQRLEEAEAAFTQASRLFPADARSKGKLQQVKTAMERQKQDLDAKRQFEGTLAAAEQALANNELAKARNTLALAARRQQNDVRVANLSQKLKDKEEEARQKLKDKEKEAIYQREMVAGDLAVEQSDLVMALGHFRSASAARPAQAAPRENTAIIQTLQQASASLTVADKLRGQRDVAKAYEQTMTAMDSLQAAFAKGADAARRFAPALKKMTADTSSGLRRMLDDLLAMSKAREQEGLAAMAKEDYALAARQYQSAETELSKAKALVKAVDASPLKGLRESLDEQAKEVDTASASLELNKDKGTGLARLQEGRELLKQAKLELAKSKEASVHLLNAQTVLVNATSALEAAQKCPGIDAKIELKNAREASRRVAKLVQPIDDDSESPKAFAAWTFAKNQWVLHRQAPRTWVQSVRTPTGTIASPTVEFPVDFELTIEVSIVDKEGQPQNGGWKYLDDFLTIRLVGQDTYSPDLVMVLGKDPAIKFQDLSRVLVGKKSYSFSSGKDLVRLRLVRHQGNATLTIGERAIAFFPLGSDFHQLSFSVINGQNVRNELTAFAAIFKVNVRAFGARPRGKEGPPGQNGPFQLPALPRANPPPPGANPPPQLPEMPRPGQLPPGANPQFPGANPGRNSEKPEAPWIDTKAMRIKVKKVLSSTLVVVGVDPPRGKGKGLFETMIVLKCSEQADVKKLKWDQVVEGEQLDKLVDGKRLVVVGTQYVRLTDDRVVLLPLCAADSAGPPVLRDD
jgi:hypothetical protein